MHKDFAGLWNVQLIDSKLGAPLIGFEPYTRMWWLGRSFTVHDERNGYEWNIPLGFMFDLASIPRLAWPLCAPFELSIVAPLAHDYIGHTRGAVAPGVTYTRPKGDKLFLDLMRSEGIRDRRALPAYRAVQLFYRRRF